MEHRTQSLSFAIPKVGSCDFALATDCALLVFMLVMGTTLGLFARWKQQVDDQRAAVEAIAAAGGVIAFDYQIRDDDEGEYVSVFAEPTGSPWLREHFGEDATREVVLVSLESHWRPSVFFYRSRNDPTNSQVAADLHRHLHNLPQLGTLRLIGYQFTDNWLKHVEGLTSLQRLDLLGTRITPEAVAKLQRKLPGCEIVHRGQPARFLGQPNPRRQDAQITSLTFADLKFAIPKDEDFGEEMIPDEIKQRDGSKIRIRGFIFPGSDIKKTGNKEFVLVRDNNEGFPRPIYDNIHIKLPEGTTAKFTVKPVTVSGTFRVKVQRGSTGQLYSIFELKADELKYD